MNDWLTLTEALSRTMRAHAPEWTDRNEADPGITMLEILAYLAEGLRFHVGAVPGGAPAAARIVEALSAYDATAGTAQGAEGAVVVRGEARSLAQTIVAGSHRLVSDEPASAGGTDSGPTPYDLLLAALGSCTSMTLLMYARRKQWPLERVTVRLRHSRAHADDCANCETADAMLTVIERDIGLEGALDDEQRARLLAIADRCPVHRTLTSTIEIRSRLT